MQVLSWHTPSCDNSDATRAESGHEFTEGFRFHARTISRVIDTVAVLYICSPIALHSQLD